MIVNIDDSVKEKVSRALIRLRFTPLPLSSARVLPSLGNLQTVHCLANAHPGLLDWVRGRCVAYARSGLDASLCEYAACSDVLKMVGPLS